MSWGMDGLKGRWLRVTCIRCGSADISEGDMDFICNKCHAVFTAKVTRTLVAGDVDYNVVCTECAGYNPLRIPAECEFKGHHVSEEQCAKGCEEFVQRDKT